MLEVEIQKLTAAIEALTIALLATKTVTFTKTETPTIADNCQQLPTEIDDYVRRTADLHDERDQKLADLYKAEQAKTKRKAAKVTPEETKALVEASTESNELKSPINSPDLANIPANIPAENSPEKEVSFHPVSAGRPDITETSLKTIALEIVRVDSSAREKVLALLAEYNAKTFVQLSPKHHHEVHAKLSAIAAEVGSA